MENFSVKVASKIMEVMKKVQYLKKDGKVDAQKFGINYNYLSEAKITENIRTACIEVGLVIIPAEVCDLGAESSFDRVKIGYKVVDIESGEFEFVEMTGKGQDKGDKSMYKALTGAYKYMQRQVFAIPTGDDPDKVASEVTAEEVELARIEEENRKKSEAALNKQSENSKGSDTSGTKGKQYTDAQKVYILAQKKGKTNEQVKEVAKGMFGKESLNELSKEQLATIKARLEKLPDAEGAGHQEGEYVQ